MEVKLIAMTDAVFDYGSFGKGLVRNGVVGNSLSPVQVCNLAAKTCTSEDAGDLLEPGYIEGEPCPRWTNGLELGPLRAAIRSGHESVLEHAVYTFEVKGVSRALTHQLVRHRVASYSQQSQRYVNMEDFNYVIPESIKVNENVWNEYSTLMEYISDLYREMVDKYNIPGEDARYILPNACATNIVVTMNARELLHFFALRCCNRAQWEIRELAEKMLKLCWEVSPIIFEDAGPSCVRDGFCRESKSCGRAPKLKQVLEIMDEMKCEESIREEQSTAEGPSHTSTRG